MKRSGMQAEFKISGSAIPISSRAAATLALLLPDGDNAPFRLKAECFDERSTPFSSLKGYFPFCKDDAHTPNCRSHLPHSATDQRTPISTTPPFSNRYEPTNPPIPTSTSAHYFSRRISELPIPFHLQIWPRD